MLHGKGGGVGGERGVRWRMGWVGVIWRQLRMQRKVRTSLPPPFRRCIRDAKVEMLSQHTPLSLSAATAATASACQNFQKKSIPRGPALPAE